jgi:polyprenyl-phospho-N-acetylgalactosaminyl synthase
MHRVAIIIPVFNESPQILETVITGLIDFDFAIYLVNDGSSVDYLPLVQTYNLQYLSHDQNKGQGAALMYGMKTALAHKMEYCVFFDGDGQHQANDLPKLLNPLFNQTTDITLGSRFLVRSSTEKVPFSRRLLLFSARFFHGILYGIWLTDAHNGLKAMNAKAMDKISITEPRSAHASEFLYEIKRNRLSWKEVSVEILYSKYAQRKGQKWWHAFPVFARVIAHAVRIKMRS